jgi:MoaA/NifB/PqqE/SkfB family radical SAM enzyme
MSLWTTKDVGLKVTMDISTYCNAGCPQCHRTHKTGLGKADWLPLIQWDIEQFKQAITPSDFKDIQRISFVGSWGDCIMNKDIFQIIEYIISYGCPVDIETNGSIRDEAWWWNLGVMAGEKLFVRFDVDGIDQEMHAKYRRFTSLQKVLDNMLTLSQTKSRVGTQTVVFKHNQDYLKEILQLCKEYGSQSHTNVISDRFYNGNSVGRKFFFTNENGEEEFLEWADSDVLQAPYISGTKLTQLDNNITCRWAFPRNEILVMPNGDVIPCCYHGNAYFKYLQDGKEVSLTQNKHFKEYLENREDHNVFKKSFSEIINSKWFSNTLLNSFNDENPIPQCVQYCSGRIKPQQQLRERFNDI